MDNNEVCTICKQQYEGPGNNAMPYTTGLCCNECNALKVVPLRIKIITEQVKEK